jgi:WD40 repeat protein
MGLHDSVEEATPRKYRLSRRQSLSSLKFAPANTKIAVGYNDGQLQIYDYLSERTTLQRNAHASRIASLDWQNTLIFTGSKDKRIKATDCRSSHEGPILAQKHDQ